MNKQPKILLLIPPSFLYPMGPAYVAQVLVQAGLDFDVYGFFYDNRAWYKRNFAGDKGAIDPDGPAVRSIPALTSVSELFDLIADEKYDFVLAGGLIGFFRWFYQIMPQVKGFSPTSTVIMGGGITKDLAENVIFEKLKVDYILRGEAETNLVELLRQLGNGGATLAGLSTVPGLCWKDSAAAIRRNATVRCDISASETLPAWDAFNIHEYLALSDTLFRYNMTFFPVMAGRGCPNVCAFCSPSVGKFSPRSVESTIAEMKHWMSRYTFNFFFIYSEVAFDNEEWARQFCTQYAAAIGKPWVGQLRTDVKFSKETYRMMKDSGCMFICMGVESACDRILGVMNKHTSMSDTMRNLTLAREAGMHVFGNFMFGHETETADEIRHTFDFLNQHDLISGPSNGLATLIIYPGTAYYRTGEKLGLVDDPFKFLLTYSLKAGISDVRILDKVDNILNITALPTNEFFQVVCTENIKHRRLYAQRHTARNVCRSFSLDSSPGFTFVGECPTCGSRVAFDAAACRNPLDISVLCRSCFYLVHVDIFGFDDMRAQLEYLAGKIDASESIVVYGKWIMDLIFCGALAIPCRKIIAWVDPDNSEVSGYSHIYHLPQLSVSEINKRTFDLLSLRPGHQSTPAHIQAHGFNARGDIVNLAPVSINAEIAALVRGKRVAVAGCSERVLAATRLLQEGARATTIDRFQNLEQLTAANRSHDYVLFDAQEAGLDRARFAQNSHYRLEVVLLPEFVCDAGFYSRG